MADDSQPPGIGRVIPQAALDRLEAQRAREDRKGKPRDLSIAELYNSRAEAEADTPEMIGAKRLSAYKTAMKQIAADNGMSHSEYQRRAEFFAARHPTILSTVDDLEAEYQSLLSGSKWHPKTDQEPV